MKKIPVMLLAGAIVFMLSSCGLAKDAEEGQADTANNIWENSTEAEETDSNEMDSDGKEAEIEAENDAENEVKPEQSVNVTEDITGLYVCPVDDSTLSIVDDTDGSYRAAVELFRLTGIDDFTGKYENGILTMIGTDSAGNPITSEITFSDGQAILTFTDSTWEYLENGTQYVFNKQIDAQVGENTDVKMTADELLDSFINGKISAVSSEDPTSTFYITDLKMDSEEWDSFSIGEKVDLDNDGENELIICGPYGGIYLDAREDKVYEFATGDGTGLMLSYVVYNGATWIMHSSRMHAEYEVYYMKKFEGADHLVAEINFGEEAVDKINIESGRKYTWNGTEISHEEYAALASKIFATEVNTD